MKEREVLGEETEVEQRVETKEISQNHCNVCQSRTITWLSNFRTGKAIETGKKWDGLDGTLTKMTPSIYIYTCFILRTFKCLPKCEICVTV